MADLRQPPTSGHAIADHVHAALECFQLLLSNGAPPTQADNDSAKKAVFNALKENYGRFRAWCSNIAAHRKDKTSLDYRLRGSPQIKLNIIKMLEDLRELLLEGKDHFPLLVQLVKPQAVSFLKLGSESLSSRSPQDHYSMAWHGSDTAKAKTQTAVI